MEKVSRIITVLSAVFIAATVSAQEPVVSGRLLDEAGAPVEFANIAVKAVDGSALAGGISNENGEFSLETGEGRFVLEASSVGYRTLTISCSAEALGDLTMPKDVEQLEAVTVQAQRTVQKAGQFLVVPDPKDVAVSAKGIDLLAMQQLPGLRVDKAFGVINVDGGTPILKINGREVPSSRLVNLDPDKVKRIEYTNSPGLRYLDRGATGVINIVLKDADDGGSIYLNGQTDVRLMMNDAYVNGTYHKGKSEFALEYSFSRRHYLHGPNEDTDSYLAPERVVTRESKTERPAYYMNNDIAVEYTYQPNDSTMLVASFRNGLFESDYPGSGTMVKTDRGETTASEIISKEPSNRFQPKLDVFYSQKLKGSRKIELNVVGEYGRMSSSRTITYVSDGQQTVFPTDITNRGWALSAEGVYSRQFDKIGTRLGVQYQHNYARNEYKVSNVISEMTKDNTYVFGQVEGPIGDKVNWTVGTGAKIFAVRDGGDSKTYVRNLSTAQLNWRMDDRWSLTAEARYTPSLPSLGDLSPVFQRTDDVEAVQGYADLKPSQFLGSRAMIRFAARNGWFVNLTGGYDHSFGEIVTTYRYDQASDLFVSSPQNSDFYNSAYVYAEAGVKNLFEHFNISLDAKYKHEQTAGEGFHHVNDNFSMNINFQTVWNRFSAGAYFNLMPEWSLRGEFLGKSEPGQNIYAQYKWKNIAATLIWHCPFNKMGYSYETIFLSDIHPGRHINWTTDNGNMIVLGLTWNFEFGSAFKKGSKTLYNGGYDAGIVR